jgi:hypothetical protein
MVAVGFRASTQPTEGTSTEEPCARKPASTVLESSGGGDTLTDFNPNSAFPPNWLIAQVLPYSHHPSNVHKNYIVLHEETHQ